MRHITLCKSVVLVALACLLTGSTAHAASYQTTSGAIVDPIPNQSLNPYPYYGPDLEPSADLTNAELSYAYLPDADLTGASLYNADLFGVTMTGASLREADLTGADMNNAYLKNAQLNYAVLYNAIMDNSILIDAFLNHASLTNTSLAGATMDGVNLTGADLGSADLMNAALDNAIFSPSTILEDGDTVQMHGFNATSLQAYLEGSPVWADSANNLTIVPEPATLLLSLFGLALLLLSRRR